MTDRESVINGMLATICAISHRYGGDEKHVIAGGGNTSCKTDATLWVKASGTELATIRSEGFVELDRAALARALESDFGDDTDRREALYKQALLESRRRPELGQRPSVEALMHHMIETRYVVHTHSNPVNVLTCCVRGEQLVRERFGDRVLWVSYVDPGYVLSRHIWRLVQGHRFPAGEPPILMMQNHGLVVGGDDAATIDATMEGLMAEIEALVEEIGGGEPAAPRAIPANPALVAAVKQHLAEALAEDGRPKAIELLQDETVARFLARADAREVALGGPLTPDQIVYCKSFPLWLELDAGGDVGAMIGAAVRTYWNEHGHAPKVILAPGIGLLTAAPDARGAVIAQRVYLDAIRIMLGADRIGGINYMSERDRRFIDNWEVEQFRRQVAARGDA